MTHRRRLPHWHPRHKPIFLTWTLAGTLPRNRYPPPRSLTSGQAFAHLDRHLDETRYGPTWLRHDPVASLILESLLHGQHELNHYSLGAYVIMPNHVHVLLMPQTAVPTLMRRLKGYTARQANKILNRTGEPFWQHESYDHWVRNDAEWHRIAAYIENNPVKAGLAPSPAQYRWSSAWSGPPGLP